MLPMSIKDSVSKTFINMSIGFKETKLLSTNVIGGGLSMVKKIIGTKRKRL